MNLFLYKFFNAQSNPTIKGIKAMYYNYFELQLAKIIVC